MSTTCPRWPLVALGFPALRPCQAKAQTAHAVYLFMSMTTWSISKAIIIHSDQGSIEDVDPGFKLQSDPELIGELKLCQPLPGSADYMEELHEWYTLYVAELLRESIDGQVKRWTLECGMPGLESYSTTFCFQHAGSFPPQEPESSFLCREQSLTPLRSAQPQVGTTQSCGWVNIPEDASTNEELESV